MHRTLHTFIVALAALALIATVSVSAAEAASCANFGKVKSKNSKTPVTVTVVNKSGAYRGVMWIDFNGWPVTSTNLNPGQK